MFGRAPTLAERYVIRRIGVTAFLRTIARAVPYVAIPLTVYEVITALRQLMPSTPGPNYVGTMPVDLGPNWYNAYRYREFFYPEGQKFVEGDIWRIQPDADTSTRSSWSGHTYELTPLHHGFPLPLELGTATTIERYERFLQTSPYSPNYGKTVWEVEEIWERRVSPDADPYPQWVGPVTETVTTTVTSTISPGTEITAPRPAELIPGYGRTTGPEPDLTTPQPVRFDERPVVIIGVATITAPAPGVPDPVTQANPDLKTKPPPGIPPHVSAPPGPGVKERKANHKAAWRLLIMRGINFVTESKDALDAIWDALPDEYKTGYFKLHGKHGRVYWKRRRKASPQDKMKDLYRHYDKIDISDALKNLLVEQLKDAAYGKFGEARKRQARGMLDRLGRPVGLESGPAL
jgi:hypothetical protein